MSENPRSREHIKSVFLCVPVYLGVQAASSKYRISQKAAILRELVRGLERDGFLAQADHDLLIQRYGRPLDEVVSERKIKREPSHVPILTIEQRKEKAFLEGKDKGFQGILQQWDTHRDVNWRFKVVQDAEKYKDKLQSARDLLALAEKTESAI